MAFILTGVKETCTWNGTKFTCNGAASGAYTTVANGLGKAYNNSTGLTTSVNDGQVGSFRVQYIDQSYLTHFAVFNGVYDDSDNSVTPVSGSIALSSSGSSMPDFDQDAAALYIFGASSNEALGIRTLQEGLFEGLTPDSATGSTSFVQGTTNSMTITPRNENSNLYVTIYAEVRILTDGTSQDTALGRLDVGYVDAATFTEYGKDKLMGWRDWSNDTNNEASFSGTVVAKLDSTHLNNDGDWEIAPAMRVNNTSYRMDLLSLQVYYRESL